MKVLKSSVSLILVFMMVFSASVFAADTVVNDAYFRNKNFEDKANQTGYETENGNTYMKLTSGSKAIENYIATCTPEQNIVIKFDFCLSENVASNKEVFIASVRDTNNKEFRVFRLNGTNLEYSYSFNYIKDSGIDVVPEKWHNIAIEYSMSQYVDGETTKYAKTYDVYYDGVMIADDVVDAYTDQTSNTFARITLWATTASEEAPLKIDNIQYFDGILDKSAMITFKQDAKLKNGKIVVDRNVETAKADIANALKSGVVENIYTDNTLSTLAESVKEGCVAVITTPDGKYAHQYELTTKIFEETFDGNSTHTDHLGAFVPVSEVKVGDALIYSRRPVKYSLESSQAKSLGQTDDDKYCQITNDTCVLNDAYPRITIKSTENVFPLSTDFTSEMSVYVTGNAAHGMDIRLSSGSLSLGGDNQDLDKYNYNSWNKVSVQVDFEENSVTASLFINGKYVRKLSKAGENLSCTEIRYFSHPLNTLTRKELLEIYEANDSTLPEELLGTPVQFEDAVDNIRITKGLYDASDDISILNSAYKVKDKKVYADLTNLGGFAQSFAGDKLIKIVNNDETNEVKEGTLIFVKTNSNDFWNVYTVTDATFKVLSFDKNANGTNATATFNNHTTEPALLIAAVYEDDEFITMYTAKAKDNADVVTLAKAVELEEGQTVKFMLWKSLETSVPYCGIAR